MRAVLQPRPPMVSGPASADDDVVILESGDRPGEPDHRRPSLQRRNGRTTAPSSAAASGKQGLPESSDFDRARVHPKFQHTNATSHKWASGAIAELLDNAVDEICNGATFVKVDKINNLKDNSPMLPFQDDGGGMDPEDGNGFKTSTMRLGADAIVFSRACLGRFFCPSFGSSSCSASIVEPSDMIEDCEEIKPTDILDSTLIEKLSEENSRLFMRLGNWSANWRRPARPKCSALCCHYRTAMEAASDQVVKL